MKFAHIADTHIRNLKYHYEYRIVFQQLYEKLREEKVDCIIHCGDLAHTKTQLSPEYFDMATNFLRSLADIAPTYVIPGNHDGNLKNSSRQDAITPIVEALEHPDLHLLKDSGEVILDDKFALSVLSIFDEDNWQDPSSTDNINIAVHHGSISGVETDLGWVMEYGENNLSIFEKFDFAFLGDIHKTNQILDEEGRVRYPGSTIQQNQGETNDKGILIWDIKDKDTFTVEHIAFTNPKPFITVELTPKGRLPNKAKVPKGARLRLVSNNNLSLDTMKRAVDIAKARFKPESVTFLNRAAGERTSIENSVKNLLGEDLRDVAVQESLIEKYLEDYHSSTEILDKVLELNKRYNSIVEQKEEVSRNINWKLMSLEWDDLFNYGGKNKVDFEKLNGIVGIFGKNYCGKSSIIDSLLFTLYNSTSKNNRKNLHVINETKDTCLGRAKILIGQDTYTVERTAEKYEKRLHGSVTTEARTDVDFSKKSAVTGECDSLNGLSRTDTDKSIRKMFGTIDDFLFTSMTSQIGSLMFISEGSTRRKEILAKFLDLVVFEKKFKLAKDDVADLKGMLNRLEGKEFDDDIALAKEQLIENEEDTKKQQDLCEDVKNKINTLQEGLEDIKSMIEAIPAEIIDIEEVYKLLELRNNEQSRLENRNDELSDTIDTNKALLEKIENFLNDNFDIEDVRENKTLVIEKQTELNNICNEVQRSEDEANMKKKKIKLLEEVPCGEEFSHCKFIKDAYAALKTFKKTEEELRDLKEKEKDLSSDITSLKPEEIDNYIKKHEQLIEKKNTTSLDLSSAKLSLQKNRTRMVELDQEISNLDLQIKEYEDNREVIENLEELYSKKDNLEKEIENGNTGFEECQNQIFELYKCHGSIEQQLASFEEEKEELQVLREEYAAYDLFMKCMHPNGIAYDIIKRRLPVINLEIAKILANIVDFEIFFEAEDKKLEIYIKHPKFSPRPIELGSGSEKTIAAMAIRLSLLSVSSLPKPDLFILDEPATALDEENMEGFIRILDMVKSYFKTVLLISHLDSLKDCVDTTIEIEKKKGFAYVNF